jgi:L-asparaginase
LGFYLVFKKMQNSTSIVILATGGTIAGVALPGADDAHYVPAQLSVEQLLASVKALDVCAVGPIECEQVAQIDSKDLSFSLWQLLAQRIAHHLQRSEVCAIVLTHGTDTLEETAYFLQRVLAPEKPVILVGAMRAATSVHADGPANLAAALQLARSQQAPGVWVNMAGRVFDAYEVYKAHPSALDAFQAGPSGHVFSSLPLIAPYGLAVLPAQPEHWPRVEVLMSHAGACGTIVSALQAAGVQGLVVAGTGNSTVHQALEQALLQAQSAGVVVWRTSRCVPVLQVPAPAALTSATSLPLAPWGLGPIKARVELILYLLNRDTETPR